METKEDEDEDKEEEEEEEESSLARRIDHFLRLRAEVPDWELGYDENPSNSDHAYCLESDWDKYE